MKTTKTLNVDEALHRLMRIGAAAAGVPIQDYTAAVLTVGLGRPAEIKQLLESRTSSAAELETGL
jgi:hypothetical protein